MKMPDKAELFRFRVEEYDRNYFSLRDVEWRRSLEALSGYPGIAIAYHNLNTAGRLQGHSILPYAGITLTFLLFATYTTFSVFLQRRLHYARDMKNLYIDELHNAYGVPRLPDEEKKRPKRGSYWYAFVSQLERITN
jgi:hypothetical protein